MYIVFSIYQSSQLQLDNLCEKKKMQLDKIKLKWKDDIKKMCLSLLLISLGLIMRGTINAIKYVNTI